MMYLLDTNVISELRRPKPHGAVLAWFKATPEAQMRISAVAIGEIQAGIEITREQDAAKARALDDWLSALQRSYAVLPMDAACFRQWAQLMHRRSDTLLLDAMHAAVAQVHGLKIATRNVADFKALGLPRAQIFNPFGK
jgi:toxin FitB